MLGRMVVFFQVLNDRDVTQHSVALADRRISTVVSGSE